MKKNCLSLVLSCIIIIGGCKKSATGPGPGPGPGPDTTTVNPQVDPALANTIGFFMDDWQAKNYTKPSSSTDAVIPNTSDVTVTIDRSNVVTKIPRSIIGDNSNTWMTQIVTEPVLMDHLTTSSPHIIRFPGGSISDVFFWNSPNH